MAAFCFSFSGRSVRPIENPYISKDAASKALQDATRTVSSFAHFRYGNRPMCEKFLGKISELESEFMRSDETTCWFLTSIFASFRESSYFLISSVAVDRFEAWDVA